ncbi:hypothetical protein BDQ17DRAFT_1172083, partial [Cyathus striatus]
DYDICVVQEPYVDHNGKSQSNCHWTAIYPSIVKPPGHPPHSLLLINSSISTNVWSQIPVPSPDITAIHLWVSGGHTIFIFNLY